MAERLYAHRSVVEIRVGDVVRHYHYHQDVAVKRIEVSAEYVYAVFDWPSWEPRFLGHQGGLIWQTHEKAWVYVVDAP